jgi:hypothetical protein
MAKIDPKERLAAELRELNMQYLKLNPQGARVPRDQAEAEKQDKGIIRSAQLVAGYYNDEFLKRYGSSSDRAILLAGMELRDMATMALECIKDKNYFGLRVLLNNQGDKVAGPNNLERLALLLER